MQGFANESMVVVMVLFMVSAGVQSAGALEYFRKIVFFRYTKGEFLGFTLMRVCVLLGVLSAFLSNTPIVAIFIPVLEEFCRKNEIIPSKVMLPLSYSVILGGTMTMMGSSSNFVALGLAQAANPDFTMGIFDMARIGLPVFLSGVIYIVMFADIILPERAVASTLNVVDNAREYIIAVTVDDDAAIVGKSIETAGLRHIPGLFIVDIIRCEESIPAPSPNTVLCAGDRLMLSGDLDKVTPLLRASGLTLVEDASHNDLRKLRGGRVLVEAVVGNHTSLVGKTVREVDFRAHFEAGIIAVHRGGERITGPIGDIVFRPGDALLLVTGPRFVNTFSNASSVFVMVRALGEYPATKFNYKAVIAIIIVIAIIAIAAALDMSICLLGFFGVAAMMMTRVISAERARSAINIEVMIMISAGFGLSTALTNSGAAELVANALISATMSAGPVALVTVFYLVAVVFNAIVTNNAAVAIMFPIALFIYQQGAVEFEVLVYVLMFAGSADFCTPIGYQTNLMVMAPGGYKFLDYTRFGFPLQVIAGFFCVLVSMNIDTWYIPFSIVLAFAVLCIVSVVAWRAFFVLTPLQLLLHCVPCFRLFDKKNATKLEDSASSSLSVSVVDLEEFQMEKMSSEEKEKAVEMMV